MTPAARVQDPPFLEPERWKRVRCSRVVADRQCRFLKTGGIHGTTVDVFTGIGYGSTSRIDSDGTAHIATNDEVWSFRNNHAHQLVAVWTRI